MERPSPSERTLEAGRRSEVSRRSVRPVGRYFVRSLSDCKVGWRQRSVSPPALLGGSRVFNGSVAGSLVGPCAGWVYLRGKPLVEFLEPLQIFDGEGLA